MLELITEIEIHAAPQRVWSTLTDFPSYPLWNPFITAIEGEPVAGSRLKVSIRPPGGKAMSFRPTVRIVAPNEELRWRGRLVLPGVFDGEHFFRLCATGDGGVRLVHGERFSGLLVGWAQSGLETGVRAGFVAMNQALKARAENSAEAEILAARTTPPSATP
ncbi:SRPBCC domain-containing protein [Methylococcus sp. EFPC2]|uniref:SRPBCC domain-containing protein n=1 Tax=Methylococcus sp. EFPC2 TaxID=2812648 RepID=UPI001966E5DB|nr:SRPBCC domain-containing protein [Methylococcus sp. EFPC2]QSA96985.1 SRPBCC domain-containing protein [Methylococcus sp. EFPC2]